MFALLIKDSFYEDSFISDDRYDTVGEANKAADKLVNSCENIEIDIIAV